MPRRPDVKIKIKGIECTATLWDFDKSDLKKLQDVFKAWKNLNAKIEKFGTRWSNLNEIISEGAASYFLGFPRVEKKSIKTTKRSISLPPTSFDCYDEATNETVQIKASVGLTNPHGVREHDDLTNFGPVSEFDKLFFLDFYSDGNVDGWFDVYEIPLDILYDAEIATGVTLQQRLDAQVGERGAKSRPHFSLRKKVIEPNELEPQETHNLMKRSSFFRFLRF